MIPKFKYFPKQVLSIVAKYGTIYKRDIVKQICKDFRLTEKEIGAVTKGGNGIVHDRVSWACVYLVKANALERVRKGLYKLTDVGSLILKDNNEVVDNFTLAKYSSVFSTYQYIPKRGVGDKRYVKKKSTK